MRQIDRQREVDGATSVRKDRARAPCSRAFPYIRCIGLVFHLLSYIALYARDGYLFLVLANALFCVLRALLKWTITQFAWRQWRKAAPQERGAGAINGNNAIPDVMRGNRRAEGVLRVQDGIDRARTGKKMRCRNVPLEGRNDGERYNYFSVWCPLCRRARV